jgi:PPOX class probable F420-dependent enzyme
MVGEETLSGGQRAFLHAMRRAVLVTIAGDGRPRPVPICFVLAPDAPILYTAIDDKPKQGPDARSLARVRDIGADDRVSVLADRWDEDWTHLGWLRIEGRARLLEPPDTADATEATPTADPTEATDAADSEHGKAVAALRAKYEQYAEHRLETRPLIRVELERTVEWGELGLDTVYGG